MKTLAKFAVATVLAMSAAAPAFAMPNASEFQPEGLTLAERNTYLYTQDGREIVRGQRDVVRSGDAMAQAPRPFVRETVTGQYFNERNAQ